MNRQEKKDLLREIYINQGDLVNEVLMELSAELEKDSLDIPAEERLEIDNIIEEHFEKYESVFRALA